MPDHPLTKLYLLSSAQHASAGNPASRGACQQFLDPLDPAPVERALWQDLDSWSTHGALPPDSEVPRLRDGTLVPPLPQSRLGFPKIPGVTFTGLKTTRYRFNYGPNFYQTYIPTINPPVITPPYEDNPANGPIYPSFVPRTDHDGNDIAGIRAARSAGAVGYVHGLGASFGCLGEVTDVKAPASTSHLTATRAGRETAGDPRPSVQERYHSYSQYRQKVIRAIDGLVQQRFLICSDTPAMANRLIQAGLTAGVPAPSEFENSSPVTQVPACLGHHDDDHG